MNIPAPEGYQAEAHYHDRCGWKVAARPVNVWKHQPWTDCGYIGHADTSIEDLEVNGKEAVVKCVSFGMVR